MGWITPKTDWNAGDGIMASDLNRIEGNIDPLPWAMLHTYSVSVNDTAAYSNGPDQVIAVGRISIRIPPRAKIFLSIRAAINYNATDVRPAIAVSTQDIAAGLPQSWSLFTGNAMAHGEYDNLTDTSDKWVDATLDINNVGAMSVNVYLAAITSVGGIISPGGASVSFSAKLVAVEGADA
ncbi:hypothetical protein R80B4_00981 [Fibrobacteres bacterium R8-0-B4]